MPPASFVPEVFGEKLSSGGSSGRSGAVTLESFQHIKVIGKGSFGKVKLSILQFIIML